MMRALGVYSIIPPKEDLPIRFITIDKNQTITDLNEELHITIPKNKSIILNIFSKQKHILFFDIEENSYCEININITNSFFTHEYFVKKNSSLILTTKVIGNKTIGKSTIVLDDHSHTNHLIISDDAYDIETIADHAGHHSRSDMEFRGVVNSRTLHKSLVKIRESAPFSEGYESSHLLLLEDAHGISIPNLEINNNEVICSHGATISNVDKKQLFYLQSRGISYNDAKEMIINGFLGDKNE